MSDKVVITIDGKTYEGDKGQTILEVAVKNGVYIPHLCHMKGLTPHGSCRVCTVKANGRMVSSCTEPITTGMLVENATDDVHQLRKNILEMLFVEGNHFCMFCEKSGNCELQAQGYRHGITAPKYPYLYPDREIDCSHPDIFLDHNRCILCARCVRASRDVDGKSIFGFIGRGIKKRVQVNSEAKLKGTDADVTDKAAEVCPVGALLPKRQGFKVPIGKRDYDTKPIGSEVENR